LVDDFQLGTSIHVCVVVVLYQRAVSESATCASLSAQRFSESGDLFLIYDNSPQSGLGPFPIGWEVVCDSTNGGLFAAYSYAISRAKAAGCPWLLLLDQDTELPSDFLVTIHKSLKLWQAKPDVVAVVPIVKSGDRQLSPILPRLWRDNAFILRDVIETSWLMAINSGTCLRVDFLESIGGFSKEFWLDYLDHWLFKMIHNLGKSVYVSNISLQHDLSVANMNKGMTLQRYRNVLGAERKFTNTYLPPLWRFALVPRLVARALKNLLVTRDKRLGLLMIAGAAKQMAFLLRNCWRTSRKSASSFD
jgi:GT2 family glycosyltransferase